MKLSVRELFTNLHNDERGEMPIGPMLIIGLIVIPLVTLLIVFKDKITSFVSDESTAMFDTNENKADDMTDKLGDF